MNEYMIKDMNDWFNVNANLIITDPPFGINFSGKNKNYHRNANYVVDGYIEWTNSEYTNKVKQLLTVIKRNLKQDGQALIFSGWNHSHTIHDEILKFNGLTLRGKLYWIYNFAPACKKRPAHNVYEIFWVTKGSKWTYNKRCTTEHCQNGEPNLSSLIFKKEYRKGISKYPTMLPFRLLQCLIEHFSNEGDLIFDPLAGSGMVGIVSFFLRRNYVLGDLNPKGKLVYNYLLNYYKTKGLNNFTLKK